MKPHVHQTAEEAESNHDAKSVISLSTPDFPALLKEPLDPRWPLALAAQHIVLMHFRTLLQHRVGVLADEQVEEVHKIRVAARRCRTALQTFAPLWDKKAVRFYGNYLGRLADQFGRARDLDVMILWLRGQLQEADADRAAAYNWLLESNLAARSREQRKVEKAIATVEGHGFAADLVHYFAQHPVDMWRFRAHEEPQDG